MRRIRFLASLLVIDAVWHTSVTAASFMDVTSIDTTAHTATGTLNGVAFTIQTTRVVPLPHGGAAGLHGGITDGSSTLFSSTNLFTPALPLGDSLGLTSTSDYKINFSQPVYNLTLHIFQLEANRFSFTSGGVPIAFTLLSSDGDFTISAGNTAIEGAPGGGDDANGSILFPGPISELSWTSTFGSAITQNTGDDGIAFQMSAETEPPPSLKIAPLGVQQVQITWSTNQQNYTLESAPTLPTASWEPVTNSVVVAGQKYSVVVNVGETSRFFRLHRN